MSNSIENIVVLMLENRSFDNILGNLYPQSSKFEGVNPETMSNTYAVTGAVYPVSNTSSGNPYTTPSVDPGESFADMNLQIFNNTDGSGTANMAGFVNDWMAGTGYPGIPAGEPCKVLWWNVPPWPSLPRGSGLSPGDIMFYFNTASGSPQLPVTSYLAQNFGVSDAWFGSCPTQTFPNRLFLHCGTSGGYVNDLDYVCQDQFFPAFGSIFQLLDGTTGPSSKNWKVYFHDYALAAMIDYVFRASGLDVPFHKAPSPPVVCNFDNNDFGASSVTPTFAQDIAAGNLPRYSFIEPRYGLSTLTNPPNPNPPPNSNHPPADVRYGEILIATVYNLLRNSNYWPNTLLIITCDEHGGCFDHVIPPACTPVPPGGLVLPNGDWPGGFNRFGPRVPAIIVSPYMPAGSIVRPSGVSFNQNQPGGTSTTNGLPFDHTSIIRTLIDCFSLTPTTLTPRDSIAPGLLDFLDFSLNPENSAGPVTVPAPPSEDATLAAKQPNHLSEMYEALLQRARSKKSGQ